MSEALTREKFLSSAEYDELAATLIRNAATNPRDTLLLLVSMHTGARPTEVLSIRKCDLDLEKKTVFIIGLKGSRSREIPLPANIFQRLAIIARELKSEDHVFPIALRTYQGIWHQYRPAKKGVRSLRHTFAIRLYEKTKDVRLVQIALGHKYLNTTQIYVDYSYNQEQLRRLIL